MIIRELYLENFGKFRHKSVLLQPGINLILGENEAGKTTIHDFVRAMLFGLERKRGRGADKDDYTRYAPWDSPDYYKGMMRFESDGVMYRMERNFSWTKRSLTVICETDGRQISEEEQKELFGGFQEAGYANTVSIGQLGAKPGEELEDVFKDYVVNLTSTKNAELSTKRAISGLVRQKKEIAAGCKGHNLADTRTEYLKKRAQKEALERQETDLCSRMEELKQKKAALTEQWQHESQIAAEAKEELKKIQQTTLSLREKMNEQKQAKSQLENESFTLKNDVIAAKTQLRMKYGFDSLEGAAGEIAAAKKRSMIAWPAIVLTCIFIIFTVTAFVLQWNFILSVIGLAGVFASFIGMLVSMHTRDRKKDRQLDYLDEGRLELMKVRDDEKRAELLAEQASKKEVILKGLQQKLEAQEILLGEKSIKLPEVSKNLVADLEQTDTHIQKFKWDLEQIEKQEENLEQEAADLKNEIARLKGKEEEIAAIDSAIANIQKIADTIKGSFGISLNERASAYISAITRGKYNKITVDDRMNITVYEGPNRHNISQMSKGTIEQMYLALRLAAADILFSEEHKPVLLDDALVMYDNRRMAEALKCMSEKMEQVILFSCHTRERAVLDATKVPYTLIQI